MHLLFTAVKETDVFTIMQLLKGPRGIWFCLISQALGFWLCWVNLTFPPSTPAVHVLISTWKLDSELTFFFLGQGSDPHHSSDTARSLTHWSPGSSCMFISELLLLLLWCPCLFSFGDYCICNTKSWCWVVSVLHRCTSPSVLGWVFWVLGFSTSKLESNCW